MKVDGIMHVAEYTDYVRIKGPDPGVHLRDVRMLNLAVCKGRFAAQSMNQHYDVNAPPTCFWCLSGADGSSLCWFEWGTQNQETLA